MIELREVHKTFGAAPALQDVSLTIAQGEFTALIGPSGSGKSTLLRLINRLVEPDRGQILLHGQDIRLTPADALRRRMGYVIQAGGLFPHWTVARNIGTVPTLLGWPGARTAARVDELLALLGLDAATYRGRYPHQLSGGQQQRVGVARALAADPDMLLMDEPFGALDPVSRAALQQEMARIHQASGKTIVLVTHDIDEALRLASRVVLLDGGRIQQAAAPADLLAQPATPWVAQFLGGSEIGLRQLALQSVAQILRPGELAGGTPISAAATQRDALALCLVRQVDRLPGGDAQGRPLGAVLFADLLRPGPDDDLPHSP